MKSVKDAAFDEPLQAARAAVGPEPPHQAPVPAPSRRQAIGAIAGPQHDGRIADHAEPFCADRGRAGADNAAARKSPVAEDPQVGQHGVQRRGRAIDGHHHPGRPAAGEERGKRAGQDDRSRAEDQHVIVGDLLHDDVRIVARMVKVGVGQGGREQEQRRGGQPDPDSLPDDRPDLPRAAGAFILGHERVDVGRHPQRKADERELQHRRRHGGCHGVDRVPRQEHPVDERHHRERHGGDDQRQGQGHHVAPAAGTAPPIVNLLQHSISLMPIAAARAVNAWRKY